MLETFGTSPKPRPSTKTIKAMTTNPSFEDLSKRCERSITKMTDAEALAHIGQLIDDSFDASFKRDAKRALYLLHELSQSALGVSENISNTLAELSAASATLGKMPYPRPAANLSDIVRIMATCDSHLIEGHDMHHAIPGVNG